MTDPLKGQDLVADFDAAAAIDNLTQAWEREHFPRLADTLCDIGEATHNPYWEIVRLMRRDHTTAHLRNFWGDRWTVAWFHPEQPQRDQLTAAYALSIPSPSDLSWLRGVLCGRGVVEIGAGNGYWAYQLRQLGINVLAIDNGEWHIDWGTRWTLVEEGDTNTVSEDPLRALMLIWPPYSSSMAKAALDSYRGDLLIYAGEGDGGCTGDDAFHATLEADWEHLSEAPQHPTYEGIHCRLSAYRRSRTKPRTEPKEVL